MPLNDNIRYRPVSQEIISKKRLESLRGNKRNGDNAQAMFAEAGVAMNHTFRNRRLKGQSCRIIYVLPGRSDRVIIVGAHFDRVADGDGVVDNGVERRCFVPV